MPDSDPVPLLRWGHAEGLGVSVAVTTRHGGVSDPPFDTLNLALHVGDRPADVATNRARAVSAFGGGLDRRGVRAPGPRHRGVGGRPR